MTIDIKTIAARMTDEEVRVICACYLKYINDDKDFYHTHIRENTHDIYTRLTTPQPQPDDAVTGEDVEVCEYCGNPSPTWYISVNAGNGPFWNLLDRWSKTTCSYWSSKDDALAQRDRLVARNELPTVDGRTATRKECGLS